MFVYHGMVFSLGFLKRLRYTLEPSIEDTREVSGESGYKSQFRIGIILFEFNHVLGSLH